MSLDFLDQLIGNTTDTLVLGTVSTTASVEPGAVVSAEAVVSGRARIASSVKVLEKARVGGYAQVSGNTILRGNVKIGGFAIILGGDWNTGTIFEGVWRSPGVGGSAKIEAPRYKTDRFRECWSCGQVIETEAPMLHNALWYRLFPKHWIVCTSCIVKKLGRPLHKSDLTDVPSNKEHLERM